MDRSTPRYPDLRPAAQHVDLGEPLPRSTRMRLVKRLVLRAARVFIHHQVAFNREILGALEALIAISTRLERSLHQADSEHGDDLASIRFDLAEVGQELAELQRTIGRTTESDVVWPDSVGEARPRRQRETEDTRPSAPDQRLRANVFGDWAATTGLAQAARRLTVALHDAGFDLSIGTVHSGAPLDERRVPEVLRQLSTDRSHAVDLWMLNVNEFSAVGDDLLRPPGRDAYAIGVWYWELPTFPERLIAQMDRVDEIWVATKFVQASFRRSTRRPVHVVPAIVPDLQGSGRPRKDFGLVDDDVIFLFSFDVESAVARKNPGAVIEAFARAFPRSSSPRCRLVIKVLNLDRYPDVARWIRPAIAAVDGVLIAENLGDAELIDLFTCADVYVSLHRSEGFGFGIAEAMALGKPVIATAYSGNVDFTSTANSCQVSYELRAITSDDHVYNEGISEVYLEGAMWAEPDVDQAARWMQLLAVDPILRGRIGEAARATIRRNHSARAAVDAVTHRLSKIDARFGVDEGSGI